MMYLLLLVGFVLLIKGADLFVEGSSSIAKLLRIPSVVIGLTIVAMGTSAPEAAVSITAGLEGNNAIALGNVVGSNIFSLLVVLGVCSVIGVIPVAPSLCNRDIPISIGVSAILLIFSLDGTLSRLEGVVLLLLMAGFILLTIRAALRNRVELEDGIKLMSPAKSLLYTLSLGSPRWFLAATW